MPRRSTWSSCIARRRCRRSRPPQALLDRAEALQPKLNAFCVIDRDGALAAARAAEAALARRRAAGAARRRAGDDQGPRADARVSDPARLAHDRPGPRCRGRAGGGAAARGRGGDPRQDDDPGIRLEGDRRLAADRHHPQPVEPRPDAGRQQRRRRRRLRRRHRAVACRQRRGRLDPHPVCLYRHFRHQGDVRPGAGASGLADGAIVEYRADDAQRARRGADAERAGAARPPRPVRAAARAPDVSRRHRGRRAAAGASPTAPISAMPQSGHQSRSRDRRLRCRGRRSASRSWARMSSRSARSSTRRARRC